MSAASSARCTPAHARTAATARAVRAGLHRRDAARELDALLTRYPTKMAALLPALWMVQEARGWVSERGDGRGRARCSS